MSLKKKQTLLIPARQLESIIVRPYYSYLARILHRIYFSRWCHLSPVYTVQITSKSPFFIAAYYCIARRLLRKSSLFKWPLAQLKYISVHGTVEIISTACDAIRMDLEGLGNTHRTSIRCLLYRIILYLLSRHWVGRNTCVAKKTPMCEFAIIFIGANCISRKSSKRHSFYKHTCNGLPGASIPVKNFTRIFASYDRTRWAVTSHYGTDRLI